MAANIEYIWNLGQYEHVKWTGTMEDWDAETAESLAKIGQQWLAGKSHVLTGRDNPDMLPADKAQELIEKELGGKVIEVTENKPKPESKAWTVKIDTTPKEWEKPAASPAKPATKGFEDF